MRGLVIGSWPADPGAAEKSNRDALARLAPVRAALPAGVATVSATDFALFSSRAFDPAWARRSVVAHSIELLLDGTVMPRSGGYGTGSPMPGCPASCE